MFEIRVAVIGYVSVGKTTLINALLLDKYGEVAMKRATAVVNAYRISDSQETSNKGSNSDNDDSFELATEMISASVTLEESKADNAKFRNSDVVQERTFDIVLDSPLHKMRPDTKLVIVDIPGINEAGASSKYKEYVSEKWHTFDVVILVMDARQGVNTEEQHELLKLAKDNTAQCKDVPLIVVGNKVDDPEDEEQKALLDEARKAVATVFGVSDREIALSSILQSSAVERSKAGDTCDVFPVVVPISAMHAFVYRCGSRLGYEDFCKMDCDFVETIGKDSYGRQWRRFDKQTQLKKAFEAVTDKEQNQDGLEASNFLTFTKVLSFCLGDEAQQATLIEKQIELALNWMTLGKRTLDFGAELLVAQNNLTALNKSIDHLPSLFWSSYLRLETQAFADFKNDFEVRSFAGPIDQLFNYVKALEKLQWPGEKEKAVSKAKDLALRYAVGVTVSAQFKAKTTNDQAMIVASMLLADGETFNLHFGSLKIHLGLKYKFDDVEKSGHCSQCKGPTSAATYGEGTEYCTPCQLTFVQTGFANMS